VGWVFGRFTEALNTAYVPVTDQSSAVQLPTTGYNVTATATGILRSHPGNRHAYLGSLPAGRTAQVVGRNADSTWWQVNYNGVVGWVRASLTYIELIPDIGQIPVRS
jgi:uncharacterized protein YraI